MNVSRSGHALVACDGRLIAIGGKTEENPLSSVEMLSNLERHCWEDLKPMNKARNCFAAVAFGGKVYAIGGKSFVQT